MSGLENERRYQELLKRIAARKSLAPVPQDSFDRILDILNAYDTLDTIRRQLSERFLCYGPKVFSGRDWKGVLIWYRDSGYYGYRTLHLIGIWIHAQADVLVGGRTLQFNAPFYEAEAYHKLIQQGFDVYYQDKGNPPDSPRYRVIYELSRRLEIREAVEQTLRTLIQES